MRETELVNRIQLKASELGCTLFRNNVGMTRYRDRVIRYGLCKGSSDLIGFNNRGIFIAVECKINTPMTREQMCFLKAVACAHGISIIAHSVDEFEAAYRRNALGQVVDNAY